jgi:hypothetical protein
MTISLFQATIATLFLLAAFGTVMGQLQFPADFVDKSGFRSDAQPSIGRVS